MSDKEFMRKKKKAYMRSRTVCLFLFIVTMAFFCILGLLLPLRPKESALEQRELETFPEFSVEGALDGSYFADISAWYSDSFPMRDLWRSGSDILKSGYGIRTRQVISSGNTSDEIPTLPAETDRTENTVSEEGTGTGEVQSEASFSASEASSEPSEPSQTSESFASESSDAPAEITGQKLNGEYIEGDTGYGQYFFNLQAANTYIGLVNRVADELAGKANVYTLLVPLSEAYYLTDAQRKALDPEWANEYEALGYYVGSFSSNVRNVAVYEALEPHKDEYIYFRTDHHWTALGAYYSYRAWAGVKGIVPHELEEYTVQEYPNFLGQYYTTNLVAAMEANPDTIHAYVPITHNRMVFEDVDGTQLAWPIINDVSAYRNTQKYSCFAAGDNPFSYIENPNVTNGETCVLIKESYADAFIPFLTDHYQYIYWFDYRYYKGNIMQFIREHDVTDVIFVNGLEPITSIESMDRLNSLLQ